MVDKSRRIFIEGNINPKNLIMYNMYKGYNELKGLSNKTIKTYEYDLFQWFKYLNSFQEDKLYYEVTEEDIEEFLMYCKINGNEVSRIQRRCAAISSFYIFLRRKKKVDNNPLEFIERPRKKLFVRNKHFLKLDQVNELKANLDILDDIVAQTFVLLAINTAARNNALRNIKWQDIDWEEREIQVIEKGPKLVTLYFSKDVKQQLLKLKKHHEELKVDIPHIFITKYRGVYKHCGKNMPGEWVRRAGKLIGIEDLTPHSLRRTAATLLYHNGVDLLTVSQVLNHNDTSTTLIYLQANKKKLKSIKDSVNI